MFPFLASALLPFRRNRTGIAVEPVRLAIAGTPLLASPIALAAPVAALSGDTSLTATVLNAMLAVLETYRLPPPPTPPPPPPPPPLPVPTLSVVSVTERAVGLGSRIGTENRGPFTVAALKGIRLEAVVRYHLWADTSNNVDRDIQALIKRLLGDRDVLRAAGFLRLGLKSTSASENVFAEDAWRQSAEFGVLYEFPYQDSDDADSLIARIPINISEEFTESTTITDEMVRWDNESAPPLLLRGGLSIGKLSGLAFIPGTAPTRTVTLTRTFDGATGLPLTHPTMTSFLAAVAGANPPQRHANVAFTSLKTFLAAITSFKVTGQSLDGLAAETAPPTAAVLANLKRIKDEEIGGTEEFLTKLEATIGVTETAAFKSVIQKHAKTSEPVTMGDWDKNSVPDIYESASRTFEPAIGLPTVADRLEITYDLTPSTTDLAVVYLRATPD